MIDSLFFFFKQKTAYEMRISDWSSDVCSSDLAAASHQRATAAWANGVFADEIVPVPVPQKPGDPLMFSHDEGYRPDATAESLATLRPLRSEERRVGKECVSTCRSRWSPYHLKKNHTT